MDISVKFDSRSCVKYLNNIASKQIPYASSVALNNIAFKVKDEEVVALEKHLDRPTPFTKRGYEVVKANKTRLVASVRARAIQGEYLKWQVDGGSRAPKAAANIVPDDVKLNAYGNIPKGSVKRMLADKRRYFSGRPNGGGPPGIWRRFGTTSKRLSASDRGRVKLQLMVKWIGSAKYAKRLPFYEVAQKTVAKIAHGEFAKALDKAISTAR